MEHIGLTQGLIGTKKFVLLDYKQAKQYDTSKYNKELVLEIIDFATIIK